MSATSIEEMTKQIIIENTLKMMHALPEDKAAEISDFASFLLKRFEEDEWIRGLQRLTEDSPSFDFLQNEPDLYDTSDLKEVYNA